MNKKVPARVDLLQARNADKAVLIVRARAKKVHLVTWDQSTDEIERGSWFNGRIYSERCDLSRDGKHLVYFALGPTKDIFSWTAVCEPPRITALVLWPMNDTWEGGGAFTGKRTLWLDLPNGSPIDNKAKHTPRGDMTKYYSIQYKEHRGGPHPFAKRLEAKGWKLTDYDDGTVGYEKKGTTDKLMLRARDGDPIAKHHSDNPDIELLVKDVLWADWDRSGRLITVKAGIVKRYAKDLSDDFVIDCNTFEPPE